MSARLDIIEADRACPFLNLPAELRNMIYAYALFEPAGLHFSQDEHGIVRLQSMPADRTPHSAAPTPACETSTNDEKKKLPELAWRVANQLQYVSHELRGETRGLGVRYNDIMFDHLKDALAFIEMCPRSEIKHLRVLSISKGLYSTIGGMETNLLGQPGEQYSQLFKFCIANPSLTVRNTLTGWRQINPMFVPYAILVQMQFRKSSSRIADFFTDPVIRKDIHAATARKVGFMEEALPPNFKIFPEDEAFDETLFKSTCMKEFIINNFFLNHAVDGGVERWAEQVKKIYEYGI